MTKQAKKAKADREAALIKQLATLTEEMQRTQQELAALRDRLVQVGQLQITRPYVPYVPYNPWWLKPVDFDWTQITYSSSSDTVSVSETEGNKQ